MQKVKNLLTNNSFHLKVLTSLLKTKAVGRLLTAFGQNRARVDVAQPVHELCAQAGNEAGHDIHGIPDIHEIHDIHKIHEIHDNRDIHEIGNISPDELSCSKEKSLFMCVKSLPKNDDNQESLGECLVSVSSHRRCSSLRSIDLEMTNVVTVDVHNIDT